MVDSVKYTVLLSLPVRLPSEQLARLEEVFNIVTRDEFDAGPEKYGNDVLGIIYFRSRPGKDLTREVLARMPNLKVVNLFSVGYDYVDLNIFRERGIRVFTIGDIQSEDVADAALGMMVVLGRKMIEESKRYSEEGPQYLVENLASPRGTQVTGATLGIVGMGKIGYQVALRARAFRMQILYHGRKRRPPADESSVEAEYVPKLHDMLPRIDYLVLSCPLSPDTRDLISSREFDIMRPNAVLINVARGAVVNTEALVTALREGYISAAGADVTNPEPLPRGHPLMGMPNVLITPHMGSATPNTRAKFPEVATQNILAGIEGGTTATELNLDDLVGKL